MKATQLKWLFKQVNFVNLRRKFIIKTITIKYKWGKNKFIRIIRGIKTIYMVNECFKDSKDIKRRKSKEDGIKI